MEKSILDIGNKESSQYRIREMMLDSFSSKRFLMISIFLSLSCIFSFILMFVDNFEITSLLRLIIPVILITAFWMTYSSAKQRNASNTTGLRIISGVATFSYTILTIGVILLILFSGRMHKIFIIISLPIGVIAFAYFLFNKAVIYMVDSFEQGSYITDYYNGTIIFLVLGAVFSFLSPFIIYTGALYDFLKEYTTNSRIYYSELEIIFGSLRSLFSFLFLISLARFVYKLNRSIDSVHRYYGYDGAIYSEEEI